MNVLRSSTYISFALVSFFFEIESHSIRRPDLSAYYNAQCPAKEEHSRHTRDIHVVHEADLHPCYCESRDVFLHPRFAHTDEEYAQMPEETVYDYLGPHEDVEHIIIEQTPVQVRDIEYHTVDEPARIEQVPVEKSEVTPESHDIYGKEIDEFIKSADAGKQINGDFVFPDDSESEEHVSQGRPPMTWDMYSMEKEKSTCVEESNDMHNMELHEIDLRPIKTDKNNEIKKIVQSKTEDSSEKKTNAADSNLIAKKEEKYDIKKQDAIKHDKSTHIQKIKAESNKKITKHLPTHEHSHEYGDKKENVSVIKTNTNNTITENIKEIPKHEKNYEEVQEVKDKQHQDEKEKHHDEQPKHTKEVKKEEKPPVKIDTRVGEDAVEVEDKAIAPPKNGKLPLGKNGALFSSSLL